MIRKRIREKKCEELTQKVLEGVMGDKKVPKDVDKEINRINKYFEKRKMK